VAADEGLDRLAFNIRDDFQPGVPCQLSVVVHIDGAYNDLFVQFQMSAPLVFATRVSSTATYELPAYITSNASDLCFSRTYHSNTSRIGA
jgi:hypothetical protein